MRSTTLALATILTTLTAVPVQAQVHASIKIGPVRIGAHLPVTHHRQPRFINVVSYSSNRHGDWHRYARDWRPVTVYVLDGRYYENPWGKARKTVVYRYRNEYFKAPSSRDWDRSRSRFERDYWSRDKGNNRRPDSRNGRAGRNDNRRDSPRSTPRPGRGGRRGS